MKIQGFTFNIFSENTYVIYDDSKECIIVDPGNSSSKEDQMIFNWIEKAELKPTKIVNTHAHIDHVLGIYAFKTKYPGLPLYISKEEEVVYEAQKQIGPMYGFQNFQYVPIDHYIDLEAPVIFGETKLEVIFAPGHAPGHVVFYHHQTNVLIAGDVLFQNSIGRTDLPLGNHQDLIDSIQQKLFKLPENTVVVCGHGPSTTIGHEMSHNPFVKIR